MFGLSLVVTLLLSVPAFAQVVTSANLLPGTWSTGSGAVTTGPVRSFGRLPVELGLKGWVRRTSAPLRIPHLITPRTLASPYPLPLMGSTNWHVIDSRATLPGTSALPDC